MASEKKHDKLEEQCDAESNSAFFSNLAEEDLASASESNPSDSISSISSLADATSTTKSESDQEPPSGVYAYSHPVNGHFHVEEGSEIPYSDEIPTNLCASTLDGDGSKDTGSVAASPKPNTLVPEFVSDHQSAGIIKRGFILRKFSSLSNDGQRQISDKSPLSSRVNNRTRDGYDRLQFNRGGNFGSLKEPNRGPRARRGNTTLSSSFEQDQLGHMVKRDQYNKQDFQTIYDNAKFFVIKSYSEDDVHKSIKYNVWSSTPNGNRKLEAAFRGAETVSNGLGATCPLFLFFSVNSSGQFLGLAEMVGPVDFKKDMDFWQEDKWNGFFPIKWHIIKDIPNSNLRHIILENNENRPVTHTRDTHEIEFRQGSQMLAIFKSYPAKTSILDDFNYYENQEKTIHEKKSSQAASSHTLVHEHWDDFNYYEEQEKTIHEKRSSLAASSQIDTYRTYTLQQQHSGAALRRAEHASMGSKSSFNSKTSLTTLTKNLSLSSPLPRTRSGRNSTWQ